MSKINKSSDKIKLRQFMSGAGKILKQRQTLTGLGLGKINSTSELERSPEVLGMFKKVKHLVEEVK